MKVGDICKININTLNKDVDFEKYLYLDTSNLTKGIIGTISEYDNRSDLPSRARRMVQDKDILLSTVRPNQRHYGILENPPENLLVSTGFAVLTANQDMVNPYYLYYFLTQDKVINFLQMIAETGVSSYPSIRPENIENIKIKLPPMDYQNRCVEQLLILERKMQSNKELISYLEELCHLQFHKWFVDYNFPNSTGKPYKDSGGEMIQINGKGVPVGWTIEPIERFIYDIHNGDWGEDEPSDGAVETYCIRGADIPNVKHGKLEDLPTRYIKSSNEQKKQLKHGDIVIEASGGSPTQSTGRTIVIRNTFLEKLDKPLYFSNFSKVIIPKKNYSMFVYLLMNKLFNRGVFFRFEGKTSGIRNLLIQNLVKKVTFVNPSEEVLYKFEEQIGVYWDKICILGYENELLEETRDLLIKKIIK